MTPEGALNSVLTRGREADPTFEELMEGGSWFFCPGCEEEYDLPDFIEVCPLCGSKLEDI